MISTTRYDLEDDVVLVTGAGSGIGRAIARAFLEQGARVALVGRREERLIETAEGFPGERVAVMAADMSTAGPVRQAVAQVLDRWGRIDTIVANAGLSEPGTIEDLDEGSWARMRSINLDGMIHLARAGVDPLRRSRGSFIAMSSIASLGGDWNQTGYNATKAAVNALVKSMALDLGRDGIRVNAIAPGFTRSVLTQERLDDPAFWGKLRDRLALERAADPGDIARAALFLAIPDAAYITGVVLPVDGGTSAANGSPRPAE